MASAFEEDVPEELQDKTIPNYEMIHKVRCEKAFFRLIKVFVGSAVARLFLLSQKSLKKTLA